MNGSVGTVHRPLALALIMLSSRVESRPPFGAPRRPVTPRPSQRTIGGTALFLKELRESMGLYRDSFPELERQITKTPG